MTDLCRLIFWTLVDLMRARATLEAEIWVLSSRSTFCGAPLREGSPCILIGDICWPLSIVSQGLRCVGDRQAGYDHPLASRRVSERIGAGSRNVVVATKCTPDIRKLIHEMSIANPLWGGAADPWRVAQARDRNRADECGQVYGRATRPAIPRMEDIPPQSCRRHRRDGSVRRADKSRFVCSMDC